MQAEHSLPTLIIKSNDSCITTLASLPNIPVSHIVPATIKEDEFDCQVESYFNCNIKNNETFEGYLQTSLLGNQLIGKSIQTDQLYDTYVMKDGNQLSITLLRKLGQVIDWRKDRPWAQTDGPLMTIKKCVQIQTALHDD